MYFGASPQSGSRSAAVGVVAASLAVSRAEALPARRSKAKSPR